MPDLEAPISDDMNLLNNEDTEEIVEETDEKEQEATLDDEDDDDDGEESKIEDKEETEEETEELEEESEVEIPFNRPSVKEIKAKYPNFFKDFPDLKEAYFREQQFTSFFPTVEDAKEAVENTEAYNTLSESALRGEASPILDSLQKTDPKAFEVYALDFLPSLYKKDPEVYNTVVTPLFENLLRSLYRSSDENMKNSASNIAQYLFGEDGLASLDGKKTLSKLVDIQNEQKKLKSASDTMDSNKFLESSGRVEIKIGKSLESIIGKDFDPNKTFTPFIRQQLISNVIREIGNQLRSDKGHMTVMAARWKAARSKGYSAEEESKIISTYLARAKSLIPTTRQKIINQALGKKATSSNDGKGKSTKLTNRDAPLGGRDSRIQTRTSSKLDYSKMSDLDILAS